MEHPSELKCCFFGHRDFEYSPILGKKIEDTIIELIENKGVTIFYFGGFGNFDRFCHLAVSRLKADYPFIKRIFCLSDERLLNPTKRPNYLRSQDFEEIIYLNLTFDYWYTRIYYRNCEMINQSDYIVFYVRKTENSGAYKSLEYAKTHKKNIIEL